MYELVKQKTTGYRIILGIIIFAFITAILKMAFNVSPATSLNDDMVKAANEINSHAPVIIDSTIRFERATVLPGDVFQYNYTLLTLEDSEVDTILLKSTGRKSIIEQLKQDNKIAIFRDNHIIIQSRYIDKNGKYVATVSISPAEY